MAHKTTRWQPDTCDCIIEYDWDDETTEDEREHFNFRSLSFTEADVDDGSGNLKMERRLVHCSHHHMLPHSEDRALHVLAENQSKNLIHGFLQQHDKHGSDTLDSGGNPGRDLASHIEYIWSFDGQGKQRKLNIEIRGAKLTEEDKKAIESLSKIPVEYVTHPPGKGQRVTRFGR